jgi:hypothetical protein
MLSIPLMMLPIPLHRPVRPILWLWTTYRCFASPQEKVHLLGGLQSNKKTQQSNMQRDK